ncbi:PhzF family phenazine biosynthesis protein [Massilia sp. CF038]|uniref:PhzF family phenazine biosynthesis protein n=1 Tax=Massilia sp. CF038 TaxID=1881045 RepID=UPI000917B7D4|nr:PhzF family phenazine biosynthesis protein [Massilia sp. CF038]SHG47231.1 phenazine biosynthesis protein PhzF family [Massilia sp. CF038]
MQTHLIRCFGAHPGSGNVAMVIEDGPATPAERQVFAAAQACSACVFLDAGEVMEADFYYPHTRSPLCLHATLAAAHVLFERGGPTVLTTAMRGQLLPLMQTAQGMFVSVRRQAVAPIGVDAALAVHLLGAPALQLAASPLLSSVGSPKLLIAVRDRAALHALQPPLARIVDWGKTHGVNGCYVYCQTGEREYEGRNFNHLDPALEDHATGVAAGALSAWLGHGLTLYQGAALGNPCRIDTVFDRDTVLVGGATYNVH